jgi:hypothetical protein
MKSLLIMMIIAHNLMIPSPLAAQVKSTSMKPVEIGTRLELFVDDLLVERMTGVAFRLHAPVRQAPAKSPLPSGGYGTIIKDGDLYRAYYRTDIPGYDKGRYGERNADNEPNEITCYAESRDGIEWTFPDLGITKIQSSKGGNVILALPRHPARCRTGRPVQSAGGIGRDRTDRFQERRWYPLEQDPERACHKNAESGPRNALALRFVESGLLVRGRELLCLFCPHLGHDQASTDGSVQEVPAASQSDDLDRLHNLDSACRHRRQSSGRTTLHE